MSESVNFRRNISEQSPRSSVFYSHNTLYTHTWYIIEYRRILWTCVSRVRRGSSVPNLFAQFSKPRRLASPTPVLLGCSGSSRTRQCLGHQGLMSATGSPFVCPLELGLAEQHPTKEPWWTRCCDLEENEFHNRLNIKHVNC